MTELAQRSFFRRHPTFWAAFAGLVASLEAWGLSFALLQANFLPSVITENAKLLAIISMGLVICGFFVFVQMSLRVPTQNHSLFYKLSPDKAKLLTGAIKVLGGYVALLSGMAATLFICEKSGPWGFVMDGITGPSLNLPENLWPLPFLVIAAFVLFGAHQLLKSLRETDLMVKIDE